MSKQDGGPAFPVEVTNYGERNMTIGGMVVPPGAMMQFAGMTIRDWFAGQALALMKEAMAEGYWTPGDNPNKELAEASYQIADAMLAERAKE